MLVVGLGNPGLRHANNRHNIGFQIVDELAKSHGLYFSKSEHKAQTAHGYINQQRIILAKPQTWMNDSGRSVAPLARFYRVELQDILVVYDDLDIPLSAIRFREAGSSGGHRGVQSIIQNLGTDALPRLRIGIGRPPGRMDAAAYVLQDHSDEESSLVWEVERAAQQLIQDWIAGEPDLRRQGMTWRVEAAV